MKKKVIEYVLTKEKKVIFYHVELNAINGEALGKFSQRDSSPNALAVLPQKPQKLHSKSNSFGQNNIMQKDNKKVRKKKNENKEKENKV